jgi:glycosyltransferase involved in cell wall biosynthesis
VDTDIFLPCESRPEERDVFVIGYVGRLVPQKGIDLAISAVQRLKTDVEAGRWNGKPVQLRIIGDGPERRKLEERTRQESLADWVQFVPPMPPVQVAKYLCNLDAIILPSRSTAVWKEQFGRVLVEAMACKIPVVGSDSGAIPEVIGDAGLVFSEDDADGLRLCLQRLIESPALRRELAERGYQRVISFYSQAHIARETARFYRDAIDSWTPERQGSGP